MTDSELTLFAGPRAIRAAETRASPDRSSVATRNAIVSFRPSPWVSVHQDDRRTVVVDGTVHGFDRQLTPAKRVATLIERAGASWSSRLLGEHVIIHIDSRQQFVEVVRDPLGVRPWFHARLDDLHLGTTRPARILDVDGIDTTVDQAHLAEELAGQIGGGDRTWHRGIRRLRGGHTIRIDPRGTARIRATFDWRLRYRPADEWDQLVDSTRALLDEVLLDVVGSDSPVAELSGGLDSSTIVGSLMSIDRRPSAARLLFEDRRADEREFSDAVLSMHDLSSIDSPPWRPALTDLDAIARTTGVPAPLVNSLMARDLHLEVARSGATSIITGAGGDDLFASMGPGPVLIAALQRRDLKTILTCGGRGWRSPRHLWRSAVRPVLAEARPLREPAFGLITKEYVEDLDLRRRLGPPAGPTGNRGVDRRLQNLQSGALELIFENLAILSEVTGVRASHPFFDPRLIESVMTLDPSSPTSVDTDRSLQRAAFGTRLPSSVRARTSKASFNELGWQLAKAGAYRLVDSPLLDLDAIDSDSVRRLVARNENEVGILAMLHLVRFDSWLRSSQLP